MRSTEVVKALRASCEPGCKCSKQEACDIIEAQEYNIHLLEELIDLQKRFFKILDTVEESDSGKEFHPTYISSCRVMDVQRMNDIFRSMKSIHRRYEGDYSETVDLVGRFL